MSRSVAYRSSDVGYNGKLLYIHTPGGRIVAANSSQIFGWVAPCDGTIVQFDLLIATQWTHASAALKLGTVASDASLLASVDIHSVTAAAYDYTKNLASATIAKGTGYILTATSGDTTGVLFVSLVIEPR